MKKLGIYEQVPDSGYKNGRGSDAQMTLTEPWDWKSELDDDPI
jgi:hypothetical protein